MWARLLATVCLLSISVRVGHAAPPQAPRVSVGLIFKTGGEVPGLSMAELQAELAELVAPAGVDLQWLTSTEVRTASVSSLISVELRGSCDFRKKAPGKFANRSALASTAVADGRVLPFVWVDCTAVRQFLRAPLEKVSAAGRPHIAARAVARLLAHELYHVLSGSEHHSDAGIAKESFSQLDLLSEHLSFDTPALARIAPKAAPALAASTSPAARADWVAAVGLAIAEDVGEAEDTR